MNINVTRTEVIVGNGYIVNKGEYKINPCEFTFSEEYTVNLVKKAVFDDGKTTKEMAIINNKCDIPYEVLDSDSFELRVYAYRVNGEELELVYSPTPAIIYLREGSYRGVTGSGEIITPTQYEQYEQALNDGLDDLEAGLQEVSNVDIDVSKSENTATVTITDRQGTEKSVEIFDGDDYVLTEEDKQEIINTVEAEVSLDIPTNVSQLENDSGFIDKDVNNLTNYYKKSETYTKQEIDEKISSVYKYKGTVASYNNLPSTGLTIGDVYNVEDTGDNYAWTGTEWDKLGGDIDLSGYYTKNETDTLLGAKQNTINAQNKLISDLVDDTNHTNKFVTASEKNTWNAKYTKPSGGIPKTDLASDVQTSLGKADTAVQDVSGKEDKTNKTSIIDENSTNTQYAGAKAVYDALVLRDEEISDLKTKNELLVKDHVPIENTGTELQLTNTGDLPMELFPYGNISQETREGYNLIPNNAISQTKNGVQFIINNDKSIFINGTASENLSLYIFGTNSSTEVIQILNGNYTVSIKNSLPHGAVLNLMNRSTLVKQLRDEAISNFSAENTNLTWEFLFIEAGTTLNTTIYPMLVEGTYTAETLPEYEAYGASPTIDFPSPVKVVDGEYETLVQNKNYNNGINQLAYLNVAVNNCGILSGNSGLYIKVNGGNYTISTKNSQERYRVACVINEPSEIVQIAYNGVNKDGTSDNITINTTGYNYLVVNATDLSVIQIEKELTPTSYVAHQEQTVSIDTSPNPLYSENDCYKYLTSEQATDLGLNGAGWYVYNEWDSQDFTSGVSSVTINDMKSNGQFYSTVGGTVSETTITFSGTTTGEGNIVYELATPTYTKITNSNLINSLEALKNMQSYYDVTNISQTHSDEQVDMIINAKALKSLKAMQSETDTLLNAKVDKSSFVYDSNTETLTITMS